MKTAMEIDYAGFMSGSNVTRPHLTLEPHGEISLPTIFLETSNVLTGRHGRIIKDRSVLHVTQN